jgi:hypothetical protein
MSDEEIGMLSLDALVDRMDLVLRTAKTERGEHARACISDLAASAWLCRRPEIVKPAVNAAFQFLVQRDLVTSAHVALNVLYFDKPVDGEVLEHSPALRMYHASFTQQSIILSRVAFECFMELIYVLGTGQRIPGKSKFKTLRRWLFRGDNPFCYFARDVVAAHRYDRAHRTPEVHARSKLVRGMLTLQAADSEIENLRLGLSNLLNHVWEPLIEIVNDRKPRVVYATMAHVDGGREFHDAYLAGDDRLPEMLRGMAERLRG